MRSAPSATACEIGVLFTTPPSMRRRAPIRTGGKTPGIDAMPPLSRPPPAPGRGEPHSLRSGHRPRRGEQSLRPRCPGTRHAEPPAGAVLDPGPGGAPATQSADERAHADRKDVLAPQAVPDTRELVRSRDRLRRGRHERSVQRTRRRSHQYIGGDPPFVDRPQHPDLEGPRLAPPERWVCWREACVRPSIAPTSAGSNASWRSVVSPSRGIGRRLTARNRPHASIRSVPIRVREARGGCHV
jgi:hypothetical protein